MLSCREAAQLISEGLDRRLPFWRRVGLRFHVLMCWACRRYKRQLHGLDHLVSRRFTSPDPTESASSARLSSDARRRIKARLRDRSE